MYMVLLRMKRLSGASSKWSKDRLLKCPVLTALLSAAGVVKAPVIPTSCLLGTETVSISWEKAPAIHHWASHESSNECLHCFLETLGFAKFALIVGQSN